MTQVTSQLHKYYRTWATKRLKGWVFRRLQKTRSDCAEGTWRCSLFEVPRARLRACDTRSNCASLICEFSPSKVGFWRWLRSCRGLTMLAECWLCMHYVARFAAVELTSIHPTFQAVNALDWPTVTSWYFHDTAAACLVVALSSLRVRWNGTRFQTLSGTLLGVPTASDRRWKLIFSQRRGTSRRIPVAH